MGGGYYSEICSILDSVIIRFSEVDSAFLIHGN